MTNLAAAIGLCQLKKLDGFNACRNKNADYFNKNIPENTKAFGTPAKIVEKLSPSI
jgi:dTDP-4-amino-4,6-dideoxygalactose transaminase